MKWKIFLQKRFLEISNNSHQEIYELCLAAYSEGCLKERALAIEAYRLRCIYLFGNRCMKHTRSKINTKKICDRDCCYIKSFLKELDKLEI